MIPKKFDEHEYDYPSFQPDQVLSADHLNHSFAYNEQEQRLTRTNLLGIGIVCGLKAVKSADGKTLSISKGTGVTSQGYLMTLGKENSESPLEYKKYRTFNAKKSKEYELFVNNSVQKYTLYELPEAEDALPTDPDLSTGFLADKVCLLFYEQLLVDAKNCDTTSCDDKGRTVTVNIRKLLMPETEANALIAECNAKAGATGSGEWFPGIHTLAELRMPKYDVPAGKQETPEDVYAAYQKIFTTALIQRTATALNNAQALFKTYLKEPGNPFSDFATRFAFLGNGSINGNNKLNFQYYYDFFTDLYTAYSEWKEAAFRLGDLCTPPEALFPRHLLLGKPAEAESVAKSKYRNTFIPSPILHRHEEAYREFRSLYDRLVRLVTNLSIPVPKPSPAGKTIDPDIRLTPSHIGTGTLGSRALPFYYKPNEAAASLLDVWSFPLARRGRQKQSLGYFATTYNFTDDFVRNPLTYDIEPFNFFRVEGHLGKKMESALASIESIRDTHRLPFDIVALNADKLNDALDLSLYECHFADLEAQYEVIRAEMQCKICRAVNCLYEMPLRTPKLSTESAPKRVKAILSPCGKDMDVRENSIGSLYEKYKAPLFKAREAPKAMMSMVKELQLFRKEWAETDDADADTNLHYTLMLHTFSNYLTVLTPRLNKLDMVKMTGVREELREAYDTSKDKTKPSIRDRYDKSECLQNVEKDCFDEMLDALAKEYRERLEKLQRQFTLAEFAKKHPGLQHKAGVPVGGTLVLVYVHKSTPQPGGPVDPNDGKVIADFYLPYLCCSDCAPIEVKIQLPEPKVTLGLPRTEFCIDHQPEKVPFLVSPLKGTLSADQPDTVKDNGDDTFSFLPGKAAIPAAAKSVDVTFTYKVDDLAQTLTVKVYRKPEVIIKPEADPANPNRFHFSFDKPERVGTVVWKFGDDTTSALLAPEHTYATPGKYSVSAEVKNGPCTFVTAVSEIEIKPPAPIQIDPPLESYCTDSKKITFYITPAGGTITGLKNNEIRENPAQQGQYNFYPSEVNPDPADEAVLSYVYTAPAGNSKPFQTTVYAKPVGKLNTDGGTLMVYLGFYEMKHVRSIEVDYGDGKPVQTYAVSGASQFSTNYTYPTAKKYHIKATLINGKCRVLIEADVEAKSLPNPTVVKSCQSPGVPVNNFSALLTKIERNQNFLTRYTPEVWKEVKDYFHRLNLTLTKMPAQLDEFLETNPVKDTWIGKLPVTQTDTRPLAIMLLAVFSDLLTTLSCMRPGDVGEGEQPTKALLDLVERKIRSLKKLQLPAEQPFVDAIRNDIADEFQRLDNNGEKAGKREFAQRMTNIENTLKDIK